MRRVPKIKEAPPVKKRTNDDVVVETRSYKLITPLFGGGVEKQVADPVTVVRAPEIRGHLRFWWRATRGFAFPTYDAMREREETIWGSSEIPSKVSISVSTDPAKTRKGTDYVVRNRNNQIVPAGDISSPISYAAFPLRENRDAVVREGIAFEITLTYPKDQAADVNSAIWAWETFGGIGGRTRRGFGAVHLNDLNGQPLPPSTESSIREAFEKHVVVTENSLASVPCLHLAEFKITARQASPDEAWRYLLNGMKNFRQDRNRGERKPGRSKWPEPDEIRRLTRRTSRQHAEPLSTIHKFPRAVFGLPIIFQFKDKAAGDPDQTNLELTDSNRWASPVLLRPVMLETGPHGLALVLNSKLPEDRLALKKSGADKRVCSELTTEEARLVRPLNGNPNVLKAFLETL